MKILGNLVFEDTGSSCDQWRMIFQEIYFWLMSGSESEADLYRI